MLHQSRGGCRPAAQPALAHAHPRHYGYFVSFLYSFSIKDCTTLTKFLVIPTLYYLGHDSRSLPQNGIQALQETAVNTSCTTNLTSCMSAAAHSCSACLGPGRAAAAEDTGS